MLESAKIQRRLMTFIEFKKTLLDAEITLPKFSRLIKVSEKNLQNCKKKAEVPNAIAVVAKSFATMKSYGIDYKNMVEDLNLKPKTKKGAGFGSKKKK